MVTGLQVFVFVRQRIDDVVKLVLRRDTHQKLDVVRKAAQCQFPTCDIEAMLAEIEGQRRVERPFEN